MAGLSFANQSQNRRPSGGSSGLWWIPLVLIIISIALITLYVRVDGQGAFASVRGVVQSVTKPMESACSVLSTPFKSAAKLGKDEELEQLKTENQQLRTLVAELEEYRQQDRRLTSLAKMSDMYGLESVSAQVTGTVTGWDRTATINKGTNDGVRVGQGVMSSCGLYGQIESVTATTSVVRLINDADSATSAMLQSTHARGIVKGAYDGTLTLEYVSVDKTVSEGDVVISSGQGGAYPRGLVIGTVSAIDTDSSKLYYRLSIDPVYAIADCEEVMVLTGNETETASVLDKDLLNQIVNPEGTASSTTSGSDAAGSGEEPSSGSSGSDADSSSKKASKKKGSGSDGSDDSDGSDGSDGSGGSDE